MILLIRHGQSANNAKPDHERVCDPGLTELGLRQAAITAEHLSCLPITRIYCSPFLRSLETARPLSRATGIKVHIHPEIFEQGGCYSGYEAIGRRGEPGMGAIQLKSKYPEWYVDPAIPDAGWWGRDYETEAQARDRAVRVARWLAEDKSFQDGISVLVIHADFKRLLLEALSSATRRAVDEPLYNVGISHFERSLPAWKVHRLNCVKHLEPQLISV